LLSRCSVRDKIFFKKYVLGVQLPTVLIDFLTERHKGAKAHRHKERKIKSKKGCECLGHSPLFNNTNSAYALRFRSKANPPRPRSKIVAGSGTLYTSSNSVILNA